MCAWLYVRAQDVLKIPKRYRWKFQTKLQQADGAYAKRPFVQPLLKLGVTLVGRLRKDAALWDLWSNIAA